MNSRQFRITENFLRNGYRSDNRWGIPALSKEEIKLDDVSLLSYNDTKRNDNELNRSKGVHFFVDDYKFESLYNNPARTLEKLSQYKFLLTPDYSLYADMKIWRQIESIAKSRYVGAYWQDQGLKVIPTISWSTPQSYEFCFAGIEKHSIVAVSTLGCLKAKREFLRGYQRMIDVIQPEKILCFGKTIDGMDGNIVVVDYLESRKVKR